MKKKSGISGPGFEQKDQSLCWDCAHATDPSVCPWARDYTPVEGWWARPRKIRFTQTFPDGRHEKIISESCTVIFCPLFKRDAWRAGVHKDEDTQYPPFLRYSSNKDIRQLSAAILRQAVIDWERLDRGRLKRLITGENQTIKTDELLNFFHSGYFESLLAVATDADPDVARGVLGVPDRE